MSSSDNSTINNGLLHGKAHTSRNSGLFAISAISATFIGISCYNSIELVVLCFVTFKRYKGSYFWSLLVASISITPFAIGYLLFIFELYWSYFSVALESVGWWGMVTGQSLVLWSRLHLIVLNRKILHATLGMIIFDAITLHVTGTVLEFGAFKDPDGDFIHAFYIYERIQLIVFSVQEIILSAIYVWEAIRLLKLRTRGHFKRTLVQLLAINMIMILMDIPIIASQYFGFFPIHVTLKAMVYSIKLKLEYGVLGKLVDISTVPSISSAAADHPDFVDPLYHTDQHSAEQRHPIRRNQTSGAWNEPEVDLSQDFCNGIEMESVDSAYIGQQRTNNAA